MAIKKLAASALILGSLAISASLALAQDAKDEEKDKLTLTGSVTFTTDYLYRGISQTDNDPAVQGLVEIGYAFSPLFAPYVSLWGSSIDFGNAGDNASLELDATAGARGEFALSDKLALQYDASVIYYFYPEASQKLDFDFIEFGGWVGLKTPWFTPGIAYRWSPSFFAATADAHYLYGTLAVPVPLPFVSDEKVTLSLNGRFGRQWIDRNTVFGTPDYNEWTVGATVTYVPWMLDFTLSYNDTDIDREDCFGGLKLCQSRAVFAMTKRF